MSAPRDARLYLEDILRSLSSIETYVEGMDADTFKTDMKTQDAVVRNLEVIGEAVKRIPESVRAAHPEIEWKPAAAMRDFLIHEYPEVDAEAVWDTIQQDLPAFREGIEACAAELA